MEGIILYCLSKLNGERSISGLYHLLKGKKSSQTIQDGHLFGISCFFGVYPSITREALLELQKQFAERGLLNAVTNNYAVSQLGMKELRIFFERYPLLEHINGWEIQNRAEVFWKRLSLMIQAVSYLVRNEKEYLPIQKDQQIQNWVKQYIKSLKGNRFEIPEKLYEELFGLLNEVSEREQKVFILRLSSPVRTGLTYRQIADELQIEESYGYFLFLNTLHYMVAEVSRHRGRFGLLAGMAEVPRDSGKAVTQSTFATYKLIQSGLTKEQIAAARRLKVSTIEDHMVELAFMDEGFDISPYLRPGLEADILSIARLHKTKKLKDIKGRLAEEASYFQIRLVLARYGENV
ncbi:helix-turn-helix domain-containing protein [Peribacillus kribbensis]|uniref:helix-turn-helix domain-containing protein n=1 Tax=Peribacillus kribbensis TaxID=356658 RepID=UPI00138AF5B2|nr:helix-turn-helix domain-containing protein [Peribacillus kribbensis]